MSLLKALLAARVEGVLAGVIWDEECAARATRGRAQHQRWISLSAQETGFPGRNTAGWRASPSSVSGTDGFTGTGPFYHGGRFELGPMALLRTGEGHTGMRSSSRPASNKPPMPRYFAMSVQNRRIARVLVLKSSVHFRADFGERRPRESSSSGSARPERRRSCTISLSHACLPANVWPRAHAHFEAYIRRAPADKSNFTRLSSMGHAGEMS